MSQITKLDLGVSLIKDGVDLAAVPYLTPSQFGWEPGWETLEIVNKADYLHQDLIDLFESLNIPYLARLSRNAPGYQFPIMQSKPGFQHMHIGFWLLGQGEIQIFDLSGYETGSIDGTPFPETDPDFNAEFLMKPTGGATNDVTNYLKAGDLGINGSVVAPIETSTFSSAFFDTQLQNSYRNTSTMDDLYSLVLVTYNVSKEYVQNALLPYVVE